MSHCGPCNIRLSPIEDAFLRILALLYIMACLGVNHFIPPLHSPIAFTKTRLGRLPSNSP